MHSKSLRSLATEKVFSLELLLNMKAAASAAAAAMTAFAKARFRTRDGGHIFKGFAFQASCKRDDFPISFFWFEPCV